jgi:hypothetical protein
MPGEENRSNPHASSSQWRHQESTRFARYAAAQQGAGASAAPPAGAREDHSADTTQDLASFINQSRVERPTDRPATGGGHKPIVIAAGDIEGNGSPQDAPVLGSEEPADGKDIVCGPLLNYRRMDDGRWHGSVLIVVKGGGREVLFQPSLILRRVGAAGQLPSAEGQADGAVNDETGGTSVESQRLYSDPRNTFWSFDIVVPIEPTEVKYEYFVPELRFSSEHKPRTNSFFVPAATESMRIMFHSCNGFSVGTDEAAWSGPCLWNDVIRKHQATPYHVMVGGGDQIYNDGIRVNGPLRPWTEIRNPQKRRDYPFPEKLRAECDDYYLKNYIRWYNTEPFSTANGQIPQLNIWDDHDVSGNLLPVKGWKLTSTLLLDHRRLRVLHRPLHALRRLPWYRRCGPQVLHALPASLATASIDIYVRYDSL